MDKDILKGVKISFGIILGFSILFGIVYSVGFHIADEIIGGTFLGNYTFTNNVVFNGKANFSNANVSGINSFSNINNRTFQGNSIFNGSLNVNSNSVIYLEKTPSAVTSTMSGQGVSSITRIIDGNWANNWDVGDGGSYNGQSITLQHSSAFVAEKFSIQFSNSQTITIAVDGSNDNLGWTSISTGNIHNSVNGRENFIFTNSNSYLYYKLTFSNALLGTSSSDIREVIFSKSTNEIFSINSTTGFIEINQLVTGSNAGNNLCIDVNREICSCGSCS